MTDKEARRVIIVLMLIGFSYPFFVAGLFVFAGSEWGTAGIVSGILSAILFPLLLEKFT